MKNIIQFIIVLFSALIIFSCTTVKVAKVSPGSQAEGLRYSLGKPFIKVTPNADGDGTYTAELIYLPDNDRTYAVTSSSFMSKQSLELNIDGSGIINKVVLSKDATANAGEAAGALGEAAKTEIARRQKEAEEKKKEIDDEIKANKDELKTARELRDQKRILVAANDRDIAVLEATSSIPFSDEVKEKLSALRSANFKLDLEIKDLDRKIGGLQTSLKGLEGAANIAAEKKNELTAYGPVFFEIKEEFKNGKLSVTLEPVAQNGEIQRKFKTVATPEKPVAAVAEPVAVPVLLNKTVKAKLQPGNKFSFKLTFDTPVLRIDESKSYFDSDPVVKLSEFVQEQVDNDDAIVLTTKTSTTLKPGKYVVTIKFFYALPTAGGEAPAQGTFVLKLEK